VAKRQEAFWRSLSGVQFEVELGKLFSSMGFDVEQTPRTGDGGVDLLVRKMAGLLLFSVKLIKKDCYWDNSRVIGFDARL